MFFFLLDSQINSPRGDHKKCTHCFKRWQKLPTHSSNNSIDGLKHQNKLKSAENEPSMAFSFGGRGFNPPWGHMVSSKDTSMSLSDCVKLATSKFELEPSSSTF